MERLGHLIQKAVGDGRWKPIQIGGGLGISHLFFADFAIARLLFGRATESQACVIRETLETFCASSGSQVSLEKSKFFLSPKARRGHARSVSSCLSLALTDNLGKHSSYTWSCHQSYLW